MADVWYTAEVAVETPRGRRWVGTCYVADGRAWRVRRAANAVGDTLPRGARIVYQTPLRIPRNEAYESARSRTIHHNLYHGVDPAPPRRYHRGRCNG